MPLIPAFMKKRHMDLYEFKGSVVYIVNSRSVSYIVRPWRDGSMANSIDYSSRGPRLNSEHPHAFNNCL